MANYIFDICKDLAVTILHSNKIHIKHENTSRKNDLHKTNFRVKIMKIGFLANSGAIAQMGERLHGMQEVVGSNPIGSIILNSVFVKT